MADNNNNNNNNKKNQGRRPKKPNLPDPERKRTFLLLLIPFAVYTFFQFFVVPGVEGEKSATLIFTAVLRAILKRMRFSPAN